MAKRNQRNTRIGGKMERKRLPLYFWRPGNAQGIQSSNATLIAVSHEGEKLYRDLYRYYEVPVDDEEALPFMRERLCDELRTIIHKRELSAFLAEAAKRYPPGFFGRGSNDQ